MSASAPHPFSSGRTLEPVQKGFCATTALAAVGRMMKKGANFSPFSLSFAPPGRTRRWHSELKSARKPFLNTITLGTPAGEKKRTLAPRSGPLRYLRLLPALVVAASGLLAADNPDLETPGLTLALAADRKGAPVSLVDRVGHIEFLEAGTAEDLFVLSCRPVGKPNGPETSFRAGDAETVEYDATGDRIDITYKRLGGRNLTVVCRVSRDPNGNGILWHLRIRGPEPLMLENVAFPILALRSPLTPKTQDHTIVVGLTKGGVFHAPEAWSPGQGIHADQPGTLAAQFACYTTPEAGLLSFSKDRRGFPKSVDLKRTASGLRWQWKYRAWQSLEQPFSLPYEVAMTTFRGDRQTGEACSWRDAADIYKAWALRQPWCATPYGRRTDIPAWMKAGPGMIRFSRAWLAKPERIETWLDEYWQKYFPGIPLIVALWGWEKRASWISPYYFPPYPSKEVFTRITAAIHRAGGHPFPWPSGYYWNVEYGKKPDGTFTYDNWDDFKARGLPHAFIQRKGQPLIRALPWLHGGRNAVLCRGDPWTRHWFDQTADHLVNLGCDMIQVDQVVGGKAPGGGACFSTSHGHPPGPGVWDAEAFAEQLRSLAQTCRRPRFHTVLGIEEPQELYNHLLGIQDYRDAQNRRWPKLPGMVRESIFGYLYHEYLPVFQSNPRAGDKLALAYCLVTGQIPHWVPHWPIRPEAMPFNGSFDDWKGDVPLGWEKVAGWRKQRYEGQCHRDDRVRHHDTPTLRLENRNPEDIVQVSKNIPIAKSWLRPGKRYRLRLAAKVETISPGNAVAIAALTPKLVSKGHWRIPFPDAGDWTDKHVEFRLPDKASFLRIMIQVQGSCRLWVDDVLMDEYVDGAWRPLTLGGKPPEHDFVVRWCRLFHGQGRKYLLLGRMLHPPTLISPVNSSDPDRDLPPILLNAFAAPDGSVALIAVNATDAPHEVTCRWRGRLHTWPMTPWQILLSPQPHSPSK